MKIKSFKIKDFQDNHSILKVSVPQGSIYRDVKVFHDGIYAFFEVPELFNTDKTEQYRYMLVGDNTSIPVNGEFIAVLDFIIEMPMKEGDTVPQQGIQIIPIYRIG